MYKVFVNLHDQLPHPTSRIIVVIIENVKLYPDQHELLPIKTGEINLTTWSLKNLDHASNLEHESCDGDSTDESTVGDVCALSTRDENGQCWDGLGGGAGGGDGHDGGGAWGGDGHDGGGTRGGDGHDRRGAGTRGGLDGGLACVAGGDGGGDIRVACRCLVTTLAFSAFNDGDGWGRGRRGRAGVDASVAFLAGVADASVDRADGARVALAVVTGGDGGSPGGHGPDGGGGCHLDADVVCTADLTIAAVIIRHAADS
jgi:hypothetical protein